jgi:hypothetical protein
MKTSVLPSVIQMEPEALQQLVAEVKETIATSEHFVPAVKNQRSFTAGNLWNIRRQSKTAMSRMYRG